MIKAREMQAIMRKLNCMSRSDFEEVMLSRFGELGDVLPYWLRLVQNPAIFIVSIDEELLQKLLDKLQS